MYLIFTDLDGTLLDHHSYSWEAARPALDRLKSRRVPWVLVTSKTRAEVELWRRVLGNKHPFIVENGGAAFLPDGCLPGSVRAGGQRGAYQVLEWGTPYAELVASLEMASRSSQCRVRGFHEMTVEEVSTLCQLPPEQAALATQREYDEPFLILDPDRTGALLTAIEGQGRRWTRGGRFWHILGAHDKALAVRALGALFETAYGPVITIGLGEGLNDVAFLNSVATPILIRSADSAELKSRVPRGLVTERPGPAGWNDAVLGIIPA
ncbi:MAG: HAD-IIB family hydrolase [Acidobacteria bacterium]|nr:HAD-IIB family hydrolase [Acidobacteriota bacterium]